MYLYANLSYNGWPIVGAMVAFEVRIANESIFTASGEMTNQTGTASIHLRLPRPEMLIEPYYGYWKVTATAAIAEVLVNDTVQFKLLRLILGDVNRDYVVDIIDLTLVALASSSTPEKPNWNPRADINSDGTADIFDLITVAVHFNEEFW